MGIEADRSVRSHTRRGGKSKGAVRIKHSLTKGGNKKGGGTKVWLLTLLSPEGGKDIPTFGRERYIIYYGYAVYGFAIDERKSHMRGGSAPPLPPPPPLIFPPKSKSKGGKDIPTFYPPASRRDKKENKAPLFLQGGVISGGASLMGTPLGVRGMYPPFFFIPFLKWLIKAIAPSFLCKHPHRGPFAFFPFCDQGEQKEGGI